MLVNELCEVTLDPQSGGIRSIRDLHARGNRLSQQLAFRLPGPMPMPASIWRDSDDDARYSKMIADSIAVNSTSTVLGELVSRGRLLNGDSRELATFVQTTRLAAESPLIEIDVELALSEVPLAEPWSSYYACRFAWSDGLAEVRTQRAAGELRDRAAAARSARLHRAGQRQGAQRFLPAGSRITSELDRGCLTRC